MVNIRKMSESDTEEVFQMMRNFYSSPAVLTDGPDEVLKKDIADCIGACPFIEGYMMEWDGQPAGYCMLAKSYSTEFGGLCIWVEDLYMKPEFRGKGIANEVFQYIELLYENEAVRFRLEVEEENEHAVETYKRNGYQFLPYLQMTKEIRKGE